ncbi:MAG: T9SS type A sorting domain-containing protein [Bacteroidales bacterium]|nr:T9SS type A sorting domain-containing protein [Bacteroidales bacterium]MDT8373591.1 T9SS type A sorting domain-containing protein [Bacteroidales bacterium]
MIIADQKLTAWPNTATGDFIRLSEAVDCRVYSAAGQLMFAGREVSVIDISRYAAGLYIIVTSDGRTLKFMRVSKGY